MNHEDYIEQACQSALSQSYPNIEIVLLDNLSNDETFSKAKKALENSKFPVKVFQNTERFGVAKNLNILVSQTVGEYICILSGDDWFTDNSIEEKVAYIQKNKLDFVLTDGYRFLQESGLTVDAYSEKRKNKIINSIPNFFYENVTQNEPFNVGVMVKGEILKQHPFDENINTEDWDMNLRLTHLGYKIGFINEKLFYYRILPKSLSSNWTLMEDSYKKVTNKYLDYIFADKNLKTKYLVNILKHEYEKQLSNEKDDNKRKALLRKWKEEKYKLKYQQPLLFFKLLLLKIK